MPDLLICSGLDPSGGAGLIADVRVAQLVGARPCGVITAQTVQDTHGVRSIHAVESELLDEQLSALLADVEIHAVKIGMLASKASVDVLDDKLAMTSARVVWDPIAAPSRGDGIDPDVLEHACERLAAHLALVTPNSGELARLAQQPVTSLDTAVAAAQIVRARLRCAVLVKGGHLTGDEAIDVLVDDTVSELRAPRLAGVDIHGTGCALSTAIAAHLALGQSLLAACSAAKAFVAERIRSPVRPGRGHPSIV